MTLSVPLRCAAVLAALLPVAIAQEPEDGAPAQDPVAEEMKAKGLQEVDGVWVSEDEVEDAEKGIFRHDGRMVTKREKNSFQRGLVRHPVTGMPIAREDLAKANKGLFPLGDRWVDEKEADEAHASLRNPWVVRTQHGFILANTSIDSIVERKTHIDAAIEIANQVFGGELPSTHLPTVMLVKTSDDHRLIANQRGAGGGSSYGAYLAQSTNGNIGVAHDDENWGPFYARHAVALAVADNWGRLVEEPVPAWFARAVGSLASRHQDAYYSGAFGKQHVAKGGIPDLSSWFSSFAIGADAPNDALVYQAGLNLAFAMRGGEAPVTAKLEAVTKAFQARRGTTAAIKDFERSLIAHQEAMSAFLRKITES